MTDIIEKQYIILKGLFNHKFDGQIYDLKRFLDNEGIMISYYEVMQLGEQLKKKGYIKLVATKDGVDGSITGDGCEHIESIQKMSKYLTDNSSFGDNAENFRIKAGIDDIIERLKRVEMGQEIIYDDLVAELEEIKTYVGKIPKKSIKNQITGVLVESGLGVLSEKVIDAISSSTNFLE